MDSQTHTEMQKALTGTSKRPPPKPEDIPAGSRLLVTTPGAAGLLDVSVRQFQNLRKLNGFPAPVVLGPRCVRWRVSELDAWQRTLEAGHAGPGEPGQLRRGKMEKLALAGGQAGRNTGGNRAEQAPARGLTEHGSVSPAAEAHSA